ncbi:hypothetical protein PRIPAC_98036 [Pristionchus pacificus]|uniref:Uncharacterized protein n=1 Tax=Pristionchus pacificus TaxID=54126 RepID=A0A2A6D2B6_PRIPA|nr:hypothetical protein PRIPAC_98036 [Pristionchus pacificus]|eukprot:PDM84555.1 hypothetical protein PRIPAC_33578 [Pristionchus pacificus]
MRFVPLLFVAIATAAAVQKCGLVQTGKEVANAVQRAKFLVGGTQADYGTWPWTVSICIQGMRYFLILYLAK